MTTTQNRYEESSDKKRGVFRSNEESQRGRAFSTKFYSTTDDIAIQTFDNGMDYLLAIFKKKNHHSKTEKLPFTVRILKTRLVFQRISFGAKRNMSVKRGRLDYVS